MWFPGAANHPHGGDAGLPEARGRSEVAQGCSRRHRAAMAPERREVRNEATGQCRRGRGGRRRRWHPGAPVRLQHSRPSVTPGESESKLGVRRPWTASPSRSSSPHRPPRRREPVPARALSTCPREWHPPAASGCPPACAGEVRQRGCRSSAAYRAAGVAAPLRYRGAQAASPLGCRLGRESGGVRASSIADPLQGIAAGVTRKRRPMLGGAELLVDDLQRSFHRVGTEATDTVVERIVEDLQEQQHRHDHRDHGPHE